MLKPQYKLTDRLLTTLTRIERLYGEIEALKIPQKLELNLKRDNLVKSSYASNRIEGNPLTLPEVTNLILDDRVPANRDEKEVVNYFSLLSNLKSYKERDLSLDLIKDLHGRLFSGVEKEAGKIRNAKVVIGKYGGKKRSLTLKVKHDPPFHKRGQIEKALAELFAWLGKNQKLPTIIKTGIFHHQFVYVHPFEDGNGRVCRIATSLLFIKDNYQINKYFVLDDYYDIDKIQYSDKLHTADGGDKTEWLEYFADGVKHSLKSAVFRVKNALQTLSIKERPTPKERLVLEMIQTQPELTSQDAAKKLKVTRQQAHNLLSSLVNKGLLKRRGTTKSSYYVLK